MTTEIDRLNQIISQLKETVSKQQEQIELLQREVDDLSNKIKNFEKTEDEEEEGDEIYSVVDNKDEAEWLPLNGYETDYVIYNCYPYPIKNLKSGKIIKENINKTSGYVQISLKGKCQQKHQIIAKQFILNEDPKNKTKVDHIDHDKTNYHLTNLRYVTSSENNKNRSSYRGIKYEFVNSIPNEAIKIEEYGKHLFDDYYFHNNVFYFYNGINYRKLHINEDKNGYKFVNLIDTDGKKACLMISKFKKLYDIGLE